MRFGEYKSSLLQLSLFLEFISLLLSFSQLYPSRSCKLQSCGKCCQPSDTEFNDIYTEFNDISVVATVKWLETAPILSNRCSWLLYCRYISRSFKFTFDPTWDGERDVIALKLYIIDRRLLIKSNFSLANAIDPRSQSKPDTRYYCCYCRCCCCCYYCWVLQTEIASWSKPDCRWFCSRNEPTNPLTIILIVRFIKTTFNFCF